MRYIIIEDEPIASDNLLEIIKTIRPDYELVAILNSVETSVDFLKAEKVDLIFMDIDLGDGTCFDIIEQTNIQTPIIFTTAYNEYVLNALKAFCIDYLLKPITESAVEQSILKFESITDIFNSASKTVTRQRNSKVDRILISKNKCFFFLNISDIAYFCTEDRYVVAYTKNGNCEITNLVNMEEVISIVSENDFFQLSRSVVSSIEAIKSVQKGDNQRLSVTICAGNQSKTVIISANRRKEFLNWLGH